MNTGFWLGARPSGRFAGWGGSLAQVAAEYVERRSPEYAPARWNDGGPRQQHTSSYAYACDRPDAGDAQPGRGGGLSAFALDRAGLDAAALADGLLPSGRCGCPGPCWHQVALVLAPGEGFHWYRQDRDGRWSHKPPGGPVTNLDASGRPIRDPRHADRGPYRELVGLYCIDPQRLRVR